MHAVFKKKHVLEFHFAKDDPRQDAQR